MPGLRLWKLVGFVAMLACVTDPLAATVIYDSAGFESPKFATGPLDGQDNGAWIESGGNSAAGTATVENTAAYSGSQAVSINRAVSSQLGGDKRYWPVTPTVTPTASQNIIRIAWDMNVAQNSTAGVNTGPFFGIEAYDPNVNLIAAAGVDATTGEVLFADPAFGGGFNNTLADFKVSLGAWNHFLLSMDYATQTASIYVNGALEQATAFDSTAVTQFADADLSAIATNAEPPLEAGSALFDNYSVTNTSAVPEPSSVLVMALGGLLVVRRPSRKILTARRSVGVQLVYSGDGGRTV